VALLASGTRISETLIVDRLLGEGAYAEVHRVRHEYLGWQAMKLFKRVASLEDTYAMLDEARLLSTLGHPNIVRLFDANMLKTPDGLWRGYFTMEYIAGGSLERLIRGHAATSVPVDMAVKVIEQIASALELAHQQTPPIIHRDLTLDNVLVGYDGSGILVRLSDFGLAKHADPLTHLASAQGTYASMAPEVQRLEGYSCAGDVWALGVIAYLLLTNNYPYDDGSPFHRYFSRRYREPPLSPSRFNDNVDEELDRIVLVALAADPRDRTPNATVLSDQLRHRRESGVAKPTRPQRANAEPRVSSPIADHVWRLAERGLELAKDPETLHDAADLMEEAVTLSPAVREQYLHLLTLWRRGVTM
jgi:serine/threonine protein kinase